MDVQVVLSASVHTETREVLWYSGSIVHTTYRSLVPMYLSDGYKYRLYKFDW